MTGLGYLIPLITFPYIVRVVGVETYGRLSFAMATIAYFIVLTDYGFTLSATRDIAANIEDRRKLAEIFSAVLTIKFLLMMLSFLLLTALVLSVGAFREDAALFYISFGVVFGNVLMPIWFFQGVQQMGYITVLDLGAKLLFAGLLFLLVKDPSDYLFVPALTSIGLILSGVAGLVIIKKQFGIGLSLTKVKIIKEQVYGAWHVFTTRIFLNLYTTSNIVLLGLLTNPTVVGQYAIAEKIVGVLSSVFNSANQAVYPHLVTKWKHGTITFYRQIRILTFVTIAASSCVAAIFYCFAGSVVTLISGAYNSTITLLFSILLIRLIFSSLGSLYTNSLIILDKARQFQWIMIWTALLNLLIVVPVIFFKGAIGLAVTSVIITVLNIVVCIATFHHIPGKKD